MYPVYYAYWDEYNYADTFITKDYSATVKDAGVAEDAATRVLLEENGIDADEVPPSPGDVWPPALAPTPAPRPRTVSSSDEKARGPFAGLRKRFSKGEEL